MARGISNSSYGSEFRGHKYCKMLLPIIAQYLLLFSNCLIEHNASKHPEPDAYTANFAGTTKPQNDVKAPSNGFNFIVPRSTQAAVIVYKPISCVREPLTFLPAHVSQDGALPPGTEILIPKNICRVWWQDDLKKSSMFRDRNAQVHIDEAGEYISDACTLELDTASSKEISYDSTGLWRGIALRPSKAFQSGGMIASKPDTNAVDTCFRTIT
jgi:hypothetical protein